MSSHCNPRAKTQVEYIFLSKFIYKKKQFVFNICSSGKSRQHTNNPNFVKINVKIFIPWTLIQDIDKIEIPNKRNSTLEQD